MGDDVTITWQDFEKVDIRIGTIIKVEDFPEARKPAYILHVDFGSEIGLKKSSSQITDLYNKENLQDKQVMGVVNFAPKQVGPIMSECLVLGFYRPDNSVVLEIHYLCRRRCRQLFSRHLHIQILNLPFAQVLFSLRCSMQALLLNKDKI